MSLAQEKNTSNHWFQAGFNLTHSMGMKDSEPRRKTPNSKRLCPQWNELSINPWKKTFGSRGGHQH